VTTQIQLSRCEQAVRTGRRVFFEDYSGTIRQAPENYCLAIRRADGTWFAAPDKASTINAHSLTLVLAQNAGITGDALAHTIERGFWGESSILPRRLFIGIYPCGIVYADRNRLDNHDYKRLAFLPYKELALRWENDVPAELRPLIEEDAAKIIARRGEQFVVSGSSQTVTLGE
jgi:hypothetical protein